MLHNAEVGMKIHQLEVSMGDRMFWMGDLQGRIINTCLTSRVKCHSFSSKSSIEPLEGLRKKHPHCSHSKAFLSEVLQMLKNNTSLHSGRDSSSGAFFYLGAFPKTHIAMG